MGNTEENIKVIEGTVINIAKSSILDEKLGEIYPVLIELKRDTMN